MSETAPHILVVDDVAENRDLLVRRLQRLGLSRVDQAEDGVQALEAISRTAYDLVLLDIMMPELDGFGVLDALRRDGRIGDLPVVVISALNDMEPVVRCIELGAEDFIFKPFNPTLLRARVLATLEKKALRDRTRNELKRKQAELEEARTLQLSLVPPSFAGSVAGRELSIAAMLEPAKEVGGDLVDYFRVGENLVVLALGDVSDKGAGAALVMARTHAMLRGLAVRPDAEALFRAPARAAELMNAALCQGNPGCMFVTFVLATLDVASGHLVYVRAGHIPPFLADGAGGIVRLDLLGGPPFGIVEEASYQAGQATLRPGGLLLIVTDGFTEAQDPGGALYGEPAIEAAVAAAAAGDSGVLGRIVADVRAFESGLPAADDMAAIVLSFGH